MSEELLIKHCSPTLAGIKTANLFTASFENREALNACLRCWNCFLTRKGLRSIPLRVVNGRALIYVYRPARLKQDLRQDSAEHILLKRGYCTEAPEKCIAHLMERLRTHEDFPHEIGLFLGYPPEDVSGFIENRACGCKCLGCWKVYGDVEAAQKTFAKYKKCTAVYGDLFAQGRSVERLTVAG